MKQHIETKLGVAVILIFAITVGAFVWKWEKKEELMNTPTTQNLNETLLKKSISQDQESKTIEKKSDENKLSDLEQNIEEGVDTNKYTNKTYGFEFEYPKNLVIAQDATESVFGLSTFAEGQWVMNITTIKNTSSLSLNQATDKALERFNNYKVTTNNIDIDGVPAKKYSVQNHGDNGYVGVIIIKESNIITILGDDSNSSLKKIFETVIDSFKFNQ